ncbi:DUF2214 family protein [Chelativorans sp.]|uniref:DUF2214 family protein n=1 Tax=Chelativorans sp. TaxID=2203393 RepID=UPI002811A45D|nr:DUF2214 family protein [Chelativorans sp.]
MFTDLLLAIFHHLLMFMLFAVLVSELILMRSGLSGRELKALVHVDRMYGLVALAIIAVGIGRVVYGLKGWEYYLTNGAFWAKMAAFIAVGIISFRPTMRIMQWSRASRSATGGYIVPDIEIAAMRRYLLGEVAVFALIPIFAAMMARGIG